MNAIAALAVTEALALANERTEGYRRERANDRLAASGRKHARLGAIASAVSSLRATLSAVEVDRTIPTLSDYPYRS